MTCKELRALLPDNDTPVFVHANDEDVGQDYYAPLDDVIHIGPGLSLGSTSMLSGNGPEPLGSLGK